MQVDDFHAASQGVLCLGQQKEVRRACQQEAAWLAITVYHCLDRQQQLRCPLHLVKNHAFRQALDKSERILLRRFEQRGVIKVQITTLGVDALGERRLAHLPWPQQANHWRVGERFEYSVANLPREIRKYHVAAHSSSI
ncbi:hypothetical protein [Halomonas sp. JS92-SW72]|uniref:hypothetical protein n=1 Tax=Halomonas sp. JS92-SW72 TaxID=2306583 RepID=UPI001F08B594|nr:hypothetical protein [Halomonas sp. JS92-SW72]